MSFAAVDFGILLPAFAAGLLVLATHVPLGGEVLRRGIIFIDLAIAQFAGLGIVIASALGFEASGWRMQLAAVLAALTGALLLRALERRAQRHLEALIGVGFVTAACAAIVLMSHDPHAGEHLQELLVGQILWSTWGDLGPLALVTAAVLAAWHDLRLKDSPLGFYGLFAVTVTASVQVVGVYLVFASLIVPALAAGGRFKRGYGIGAAGYALGLLASALFDLPAGAAIVLGLVAVGGFTALVPSITNAISD
ncbi:MAG: metal ABC transporter permease [Pseudomonadales bacterium]|nr:metal ABC transporter permease [Pseudomonadales bacterium]MCP5333181.1 metal ABC transporter permease [Pseudomonadales bacterium]